MRALCRRFNRKGQSLILVFLVLIALAGVLALTFDYGFVLLARRQMQTGVNAAALEGLRGKGHQGVGVSDEDRRSNALKVLRLNFDDDFNLDGNETTIGAGIDSSLIQRDGNAPDHLELGDSTRPTTGAYTIGEKDTTLDQDLANRSEFIYRPDTFELNIGNDGDNDGEVNPEGDMVAGDYNESDTEHREGPRDLAIEPPSYARTDFAPSSIVDTLNGDYNSLLVRMRRTHNSHGLDQIAGVSSRSGGLPLMLGRLGWMNATDVPAPYSVRREGVTVRSTAIASARHVKSVGFFESSIDLPGAPRLAIEVGSWGIFPKAVARPVQIDAQGKLQTVAVANITGVAPTGTAAVVEVPASLGFPDPDGDVDNYFTIQINDELITVIDIDGTDWTVTPQPSTTTGKFLADESVVGVHLATHLIADIPNGMTDTIHVRASNDFIDPNGKADASFQIQIGIDDLTKIETLRVIDINDDDPTQWTVERGTNAGPHLLNDEVRIPFARSLASSVSPDDTQIFVHSVLTPIDPDGVPSLYYLVKVDNETLRVIDINDDINGFPTIWSVERQVSGTSEAHSAYVQIRPVTSGAVIGMVRVAAGGIPDPLTTKIIVDTSGAMSSFRDPNNMPRAMFRVRIGNEVLRVRDFDDADDTLWTVDRGVVGTASPHSPNAAVTSSELVSFGDEAKRWEQYPSTDNESRMKLAPTSVTSFPPIYQLDTAQAYSSRIVAFGSAVINSSAIPWDFPSVAPTRIGITIEKQASHVVVENGTAAWPNQFARDLAIVDLPHLIDFIHTGHQRFDNETLLAPTLMRTIR